MQTVSSFAAVGGAPYRYTFLLVVCNTYLDSVRDELNRQAEAFAGDLHGTALLAQSFRERIHDTADEVLAKPWPTDIRDRIEDEPDPFIVVISQAFRDFDPREHAYAVIWLSEFDKDPDSVRRLLQTLARKTKKSEDVIDYLRSVAEKTQQAARHSQAAGVVRSVARVASYVQIKPSVFGVSIDLKAVLADIADRLGP